MKRRANSSLGCELDKLWFKANSIKYDYRKAMEMFINILCFRLGITPINLLYCDVPNQETCRARHEGKNPCGGACYIHGKATIYVRDVLNFNHDVLLEELMHHVNYLNRTSSIIQIMRGWFRQFYDQKTGYRKFIREAMEFLEE